MLRVTDILIKNLIEDAMQWDNKAKATGKMSSKGMHLERLIATIRSCGVSFSVWEKANADGKGSGTYDFTSLMGDDRKKLLRTLPDKLTSVIQPSTEKDVAELWKAFGDIYFNYLSIFDQVNVLEYRKKIKEWIESFSKLGDKRVGFGHERVTCYLHMAAYHIPCMLKDYENIKQFSGQGVEKNNDDARRIVQRKTNHTDDPAEILRTEYRLHALRHHERQPRKYTKRCLVYWQTDIKKSRGKCTGISYKKPVEREVEEMPDTTEEPQEMGVSPTTVPETSEKPKQNKRKRKKFASSNKKKKANKEIICARG